MNFADSPVPFDVSRAILRSESLDQPLSVQATQPLAQSIANHDLLPEISLQVAEIAGRHYGFITRELLLFDVVQGSTDDFDWLVTFCPICNAGALFSATIDQQKFHFIAGGIYNAMAILRDVETGSYWDLINGICAYGDSQGKQLERITTLRHMLARDALLAFPDIQLVTIPLSESDQQDAEAEDQFRLAARPEWSSRLSDSLTYNDERLPRFDMGLGIWTAHTARYYAITTLNALDNRVLDTLDGRKIVIYIDPESQIPDAFYTDATSARWIGNVLELNNGLCVEHGTVVDRTRNRMSVERPLQLFQRWYGFAVLFRECDIFGAANGNR